MKNRIFSGASSEEFAGYAKAVIDGKTIYVSGTIGYDSASGTLPEDVGEQTRNALTSIASTLSLAGASLENVVACRTYITDASHLKEVAGVLGEVFRNTRPANTLLICQLPTAGAKVELEITASTLG